MRRVIHELGGLLNITETQFLDASVSADSLSAIIDNLLEKRITGKTAKELLSLVFNGDQRAVSVIIKEDNLEIQHMPPAEYEAMAKAIIDDTPDMADKIRKGQLAKLQWFVGQMLRRGQGRVDAQKATDALRIVLELDKS